MNAQELAWRTGPGGVRLPMRPAGLLVRFMAWLVDACLVLVLQVALWTLVSGVASAGNILRDVLGAVSVLLGFLLFNAWWWIWEWKCAGRTPGKRWLGLRVCDREGRALTPSQIFVRNVLRPLDMLPVAGLVGAISALRSPLLERLGDRIASTVVLDERARSPYELSALARLRFNPLREDPVYTARLRRRIEPALLKVLLEALLRRDQMEPQARIELFQALSDHLRVLQHPPEDAVQGLSPEGFVRSVLDALFHPADPQARAEVSGAKD